MLKAGTAAGDTASANVVATTKSDTTGAWTAAFLAPGAYALRATKTVGTATKTGYVASATVTAGTKTTGLTVVTR